MASVITYLIVSGPEDVTAIPEHDVLDDVELEVYDTQEQDDETEASVTLAHESTIEESPNFRETAKCLSDSFPEATVLLSVIEERFDQIERVQSTLYREGKEAGDVEHGYIFNIGGS